MAALHLINRPSPEGALARCLASLRDRDTVLFYESGVLACCVGALDARAADARAARFVALAADVDALGVAQRLDRVVEVVDDREVVDLVVAHKPIVSWS